MNKVFKYYALIWVILFALFNVICFATPGAKALMDGGSFWVGYIFITLVVIGHLVCTYTAFKAEKLEKLFYDLPLINVSYTALILTVIFGVLCMAIPGLPTWAGIVVCFIVLVVNAVAVIKAKAASDIIGGIESRVKAQTLFIKALSLDADSLLARAAAPEAKAACKKVYEAVRYSDPMSSEALSGIESQITLKFNEFSAAVANGSENVGKLADELAVLIGDRNKKCKMMHNA